MSSFDLEGPYNSIGRDDDTPLYPFIDRYLLQRRFNEYCDFHLKIKSFIGNYIQQNNEEFYKLGLTIRSITNVSTLNNLTTKLAEAKADVHNANPEDIRKQEELINSLQSEIINGQITLQIDITTKNEVLNDYIQCVYGDLISGINNLVEDSGYTCTTLARTELIDKAKRDDHTMAPLLPKNGVMFVIQDNKFYF